MNSISASADIGENTGSRTFPHSISSFVWHTPRCLVVRVLRDIETCLNSHQEKLYHIGFRGDVSRTTLADANERRDWRIFQDFGQV